MSRTLADMTPAEREACIGRWAEWHYDDGPPQLVVIDEVNITREFAVCVIPGVRYIEIPRHRLRNITPRFDLPRAWTPSGEPVPGEWEERVNLDVVGDSVRYTRQSRYATDWEDV